MDRKGNPAGKSLVIGLLVLTLMMCIFAVLGAAGLARLAGLDWSNQVNFRTARSEEPTPTPVVIRPTTQPESSPLADTGSVKGGTGPPADGLHSPAIPSPTHTQSPVSEETLVVLENAIIPLNDPLEIKQRLTGSIISPVHVPDPVEPLEIGDRDSFWVLDADMNRSFQVGAVLRQVSEHLYFWVEDGLEINQQHLDELVSTFEDDIYPTTRHFFGNEWSPGVDGDPHIYILYASGMGEYVAGLFSPGDEYPPQAVDYSNAHEMFILNADTLELNNPFTYGVLAHEYQHMIHWNQDRDEESWLNEGFSELAMFLNGYSTGGVVQRYAKNPDIQLNHWPEKDEDSLAHYGASFLFTAYFLDRFGPDATRALISDPADGLESIDSVLAHRIKIGSLDGGTTSADDVFSDWVVASYLQDDKVDQGQYTYHNLSPVPDPMVTTTISTCPSIGNTHTVHQYGADYIRITCQGNYTLDFEGSIQVNLLPTNPYSGSYAFWSNTGDEADTKLTRKFNFSDHLGPLSITYWTWYDLEDSFDYVYLMASTDGEKWQVLDTPSGTFKDPTGSSYGWAYNGQSGSTGGVDANPQWIQERVDLSQFAGQQVYLRFEYITDAAVTGEGFLIDDIAVPEIGYQTNFERDDGGWEAAGFVRIANQLPQNFRLALIRQGTTTVVDQFALSDDNRLRIPVTIDADTREVILVISGTTRFTRQPAAYRLSLIE